MHCIQIVTVYDTINCGSFLQAWALYKTIQAMGLTVSFVRSPLKRRLIKYYRAQAKLVKPFLKRKIKTFRMRKRIQRSFSVLQRSLPVSNLLEKSTIIIGSDTLWNFDDKYFKSNSDYYLGQEFPVHKICTYAVSAGNTSYDVFSATPNIQVGLNEIQHITVRDTVTQLLVAKTIGKEPNIVCDPTILLPIDDYEEIALAPTFEKPYILLYFFGSIDEELKGWIVEDSRRNNLGIVSLDVNEPRAWTMSVPADPSRFLGYFKNASKVITNTFHGTVFSVLYNKEFIVYTKHKAKITDFLCQLGIAERTCNSIEQAELLFLQAIDYTRVREQLNLLRERSIIELKQMLD